MKSEVFKQRSAKNKENAAKKKYHHTMGTGGYRSSAPKWKKIEDDMLDRGIIPETYECERSREIGYLGIGGSTSRKQES